jgi:hypothetical protein
LGYCEPFKDHPILGQLNQSFLQKKYTMKQMTCTFILLVAGILPIALQATVWRVNNIPGASTDFTTFDACITNASVVNGDTVHIESSPTAYSNTTNINKRLVFIGTGYFLSGTTGNSGLQANTESAFFNGAIRFDSLASGSRFLGLDLRTDLWLDPRADNIRFERCRFSAISWNTQAASTSNRAQNLVFNKCHFVNVSSPAQFYFDNLEITNCIITSSFTFNPGNIASALIRNNLFGGGVTITNAYFANNILLNIGAGSFNVTFSTIRNNISQFAGVLPAGDGNQGGITQASLFVGSAGNSTDGQWQLRPGSPAIGAGETVSGVTPDCGPFGTPDPYRLSGIPPIPTIYSLTVPTSVPVGQPLNVTISTRSNN